MAISRVEAENLLRGGKEGTNEWNRRRLEGVEIPSLERIDLSGAELSWTNLAETNLSWSVLKRARLEGAYLEGADLAHADLSRAVFHEADMRRANLREASIRKTDLTGARLDEADLSRAVLWAARIDSDLRNTRGLDLVQHEGRSTVGTWALHSLPEPFPEGFLRGCGVPEVMIDYVREQQGAIQFYSCFISYTEKDDEFAKRLHADLQEHGVRCWFAPEDLKIGDPVLPRVNEAIRLRNKLVIVFSGASLQSDWVEHEVTQALAEEERRDEIVLFPIRLDDSVLVQTLGWAKKIADITKPTGRLIGDFRNWKDHDSYQSAFQRLLRDLRQGGSES